MSQRISRLRILTSSDIVAAVNEAHPELAPFMAALVGSIYQIVFFDMMVPNDTKLPDMMTSLNGVEDRGNYLFILGQARKLMQAAVEDAYLEAVATGLIETEDSHVIE